MFGRLSRLGVLGMSSAVSGISLSSFNRRVSASAPPSSSDASNNKGIPRADEIDLKKLSLGGSKENTEPESLKPKLSLWEQYVKSDSVPSGKAKTPAGVAKARWKTLSEHAQSESVHSELVSHLTVNHYAANNPIEDRYDYRTVLKTQGLNGMLFGVFDGHSGSNTSEFLKRELFDFIEYTAATTKSFDACDESNEEYYTLYGLTEKEVRQRQSKIMVSGHINNIDDDDYGGDLECSKAIFPLTKAFELADATYLTSCQKNLHGSQAKHGHNGSCAVVCHLNQDWLTTAWVGDCRAVIGRRQSSTQSASGTGGIKDDSGPQGWQAVPLTADHQIDVNSKEKLHLLQEHPNEVDVVWRNRVKGMLQPTRVFGDGHYKRMSYFKEWKYAPRFEVWTPPYVTAKPDVSYYQLQKGDSFLVLATDGLFEDLTNQQVIDAVGKVMDDRKLVDVNASTFLIKEGLSAATVHLPRGLFSADATLDRLMDLPMEYRRRIHDDITVLVVFFKEDLSSPYVNDDAQFANKQPVELPARLSKLIDVSGPVTSKL